MKKLIFIIVLFCWQLLGQLDKATWENLTPPEKIVALKILSDHFFMSYPTCGKAEFRVFDDGKTIKVFVQCVEHQSET